MSSKKKNLKTYKNDASNDNTLKEINANREFEDTLGSTYQRLYANYSKNSKQKEKNSIKLKDNSIIKNSCNKILPEEIPFYLFDLDNKIVPLETKNIDAWKEDYLFKLKDQEFRVRVNLPNVKKLTLPKLMIAGMPAVIRIECEADELEEEISKHSLFKWYSSEDIILENNQTNELMPNNSKKQKKVSINLDNIKWKLLNEGVALRMIKLDNECENRLIKVECFAKDSKREGLSTEQVSANPVQEKLDIEQLPMTPRHKLTENYLQGNNLRVLSYNTLAKCYSDTSLSWYPHILLKHLDFHYRRILLIHEIINYKNDIIFLQEIENDLLFEDLRISMPNYQALFKGKVGPSHEGEAILFRSDRFKLIKKFDISIAEEIKTNLIFQDLFKNLSKNHQILKYVLERGTVLQIAQIESLENPGFHFLLANTHLFYHRSADFVRLIQAIVSAKYLQDIKEKLLNDFKDIERVIILFGGDFNLCPDSLGIKYLNSKTMNLEKLNQEEKSIIEICRKELRHSLNFTSYTDFRFTHCCNNFEALLDYVLYEKDSLELTNVLPLPPIRKIKEFVSLPSKFIPSDHLAIVFEFKILNFK